MALTSPLVSATELAAHPEWRVMDCRHDLANPELGMQQFAAGHIPGAVHAHLDRVLSGPLNGRNGRHPLPDPNALCDWLGAQGVRNGDVVVACDASGGAYAARLWWLLRWLGHDAVAVLDGGWQKWMAEELPHSTEVPEPAATRFTARPGDGWVDVSHVLAHLRQPDMLVLDARSPERYRGEAEPIDPVAGRIPGSANRFYRENLAEQCCFKPAAQLRAEFEALLGGRPLRQVVHSCGSGVSTCHNMLAMEIAGLTGSLLYPGSWSEWCADPARPIERG